MEFTGSTWEKTLRQIGFESVKGADAGNVIRLFVPDIGMFIASLTIWLLCRNMFQKPVTEDAAQCNMQFENEEMAAREKLEPDDALMYDEDLDDEDCEEAEFEETMKLKLLRRIASLASKLREFIGNMIITTGKVVVTILLGSAGMMVPSLTSAVYFFVFLGLCTWWSCCQAFDPLIFSCLCVLMAIFSAGHLIGLYLYQLQFFQEVVPPKDFYARLFGVTSLTQTNCSSTWMIIKNQDLHWYHHANPILLLVMYYTLATLIRLWLQEPIVRIFCVSLELGNARTELQVWPDTCQMPDEEKSVSREDDKEIPCSPIPMTAERRRSLWYASHYTTDERKVLLVTVNGNPTDYHTIHPALPLENGPAKADMYSTPQYKWEPSDDVSEKEEEVEEEEEEEVTQEEKENVKLHALVSVFQFIMKQSYICALIAMMILFTITFWLLLRQHLTEQKALRLKEATLSEVKVGSEENEEKVPEQTEAKYDSVFAEEELQEGEVSEEQEEEKEEEEEEEEEEEDDEQDIMKVLGKLVMAMLIKYWIYVCGGMFFFVSFEGTIVMYKIIYMVLFLFCVALYQFEKEKDYDVITPQFADMLLFTNRLVHQDGSLPDITMMNLTTSREKEEDKMLEDAGEKRMEEPEGEGGKGRIKKGKEEKEDEDMEDDSDDEDNESEEEETTDLRNKWHLVIDRLTVLFLKFLEYFHKMQVFVWWLLELHIIKIVSSYIIWVSLFNFVFLIAWALALPYAQFRPLASSICTVWTCVIIVCKMLYQLSSIDPKTFSSNCTLPGENETKVDLEELKTSVLYSGPVDPAEWVGLRKSYPLLVYLRNNLLMLAILAFEVTIYRHQEYYRCRNNLTAPVTKTIFHDITRAHLDDGVINCVKYFINYFFYKFGLETCFLLSVNVIGQRMDFYAMIHAFWLIAVLYRRRRKAIAEIWPKYCCFLSCIITFQYFLCIGIPPAPCKDYPWRSGNANFNSNIIKWLYFPDFIVRPNPVFLVYDFMLLLCASLQRQTFEDENKAAVRIMAGDNVEICMNLDAASFSQHNPVPDFIHCREVLSPEAPLKIFNLTLPFLLQLVAKSILKKFEEETVETVNLLIHPEIYSHYWAKFDQLSLLRISSLQGGPNALDLKTTIRSHQSLLFSRLNNPSPQPFLMEEVLHPSDHLHGPPLDSLQQVHVFLVLRTPDLDAALQVFIHKNPQVLVIRAALNEFLSQSLLMSGIAPTQVQHFALRLVELHEVLLGSLLIFVQDPLDGVSSFCCVNCTTQLGVICSFAEDAKQSYLDMYKVIIFSYLFWFVLTIIFITGTTRISIFCMGYLVACFYFLLFGGDLLLKPIRSILRYWDWLIAYNVFVITMKNILSIGACGYIESLIKNSCWVIQAFSLACTVKGYRIPTSNLDCKLPSGEAGIIWDSICFAFLLLQRRVFMSYYFLHVVADIKASQILASRGAELFQATIVKAVKARIEEEKKSMDQLKRQMDRIKARQQKYKKGKERMLSMNQESSEGPEIRKVSEEDDEVVRSGNYYLFETDSEEEEEEEKKEEEEPRKKSAFQRAIGKFASAILALPKSIIKLPKTILQYLIKAAKFVYQAWITDPKTALRQRRKEKKSFGKEKRRRKGSGDGGGTDADCEDSEEEPVKKKSDGPDNIIKRIFNILKFTWVLFLATLDSFTAWLNSISREHIDISTVLRIERCMLTREIKKGNVPTRESIHLYYQNHMMKLSEESGLDSIDKNPSQASGLQASERMDSLDSAASRDSISSEPTQVTMVYSRQGTTETIEEVEGEHEEEGAHSASRLEEEEVEDYSLDSEGAAYTPDTDVPLYSTVDSNAEAPPSYSKAVSFEQIPFGSPDDSAGKSLMMVSPDDSRTDKLDTILPPLTHELTASELLLNKMFHDDELEESEKFYVGQPRVLLLIYALYNTLVARSEMVCYFVIILNHMISASMITLVLPILIFLWAMLSVPRPSKRFWMTAIVYTEVAIVIKYFFQFGFFPWNKHVDYTKDKPYHPPNIIGIEKKEGYVHYDLVQLLALFFHRSILKCHGLWDEDEKGDSSSNKEDTDDELSLTGGRRDSSASLKSVNLAASVESIHVHFPEQQTAIRRKSSSSISQLSHRSSFSSHRSKRGSTSTRNSSQKGSSVLSIKQKSRKELLMEKFREQMIKAKAFTIKKTLQVYVPIRQFFYNLIHPDYSAVTDVYVLMFLADTVDFIIIVFGFWAFGKHSAAADITSSLSEDQVPEAFLVMVLIQFGTMVVDRALYLKKTVMGKVIFQVILVFGIHFWMFFILPGVTERKFSQNTVAQLWYFVKCVYFGLSAYQIRCGYPTRVLGNFLTKSYNYVNLFLFQGFRLVPFLTELRAVMDWVWTDTTLSLSSWICVEDIYAHIFILKCWRESEKRYPQPRGQKKKKVVKYGMGGMIIVLLICIVWFPLLFMSLIKSVAGITNKPLDVSITITLGGYQPIFTMSAQQSQLEDFNQTRFNMLLAGYRGNTAALQFLEGYGKEDITLADLEGNSNSLWTISPPSRKKMIQGLLDFSSEFTVVLSWTIQRNLTLGAKAEIASDKLTFKLQEDTRKAIARMMSGQQQLEKVTLGEVYPYYIKAPSDSLAKPIKQLLKDCKWKNITVSLVKNVSGEGVREWWVLNQLGKTFKTSGDSLELIIFSDKVSPPSLGFLAGYGIMGLYASVVLVIGKFVREFFSGISHSIMFEELPNVDRILKLCTDIFLVRETGELELEEDLYAKLIFLYRSPETMIKWTREKTN
ncbi:hypothetical protein BTVI_97626 [Pitangus sulphuratus]|nr:hypothetical protein BTVI_97626 [Pitangus sulphuratus]